MRRPTLKFAAHFRRYVGEDVKLNLNVLSSAKKIVFSDNVEIIIE
jgi:ribosome maturation factor RimP